MEGIDSRPHGYGTPTGGAHCQCRILHLLLIASCIANAAGADDAPSQEPTTPSSSFQGEWQLLHASIGVSAMHMQLLPGDFVLMFDRTDTGPSNISLAALAPCAATANGADRTAHSVLLDLRSNMLHLYPLATNHGAPVATL